MDHRKKAVSLRSGVAYFKIVSSEGSGVKDVFELYCQRVTWLVIPLISLIQ
jgi:hypothetical protein